MVHNNMNYLNFSSSYRRLYQSPQIKAFKITFKEAFKSLFFVVLCSVIGLFQLQTYANTTIGTDNGLNDTEYVYEGLRYKIIDNTITIIGSHGNEKIKRRTLIIPEKIEGFIVTKIGMHAFKGKKKFIHLVLPNSLESIESFAFAETNISKFQAPSSLQHLGFGAFNKCKWLKEVDLEASQIKVIEPFTFNLCPKLKKVTLPMTIEKIDTFAFWMDKNLRIVENLKKSVVVHKYAFAQCEDLNHPRIRKVMLKTKSKRGNI